jgi:hypothetical protein
MSPMLQKILKGLIILETQDNAQHHKHSHIKLNT